MTAKTVYTEVQDFDADVLKMESCIKRALELANSEALASHIEATYTCLDTDATDEHAALVAALKNAQCNLLEFYSKMQTAG